VVFRGFVDREIADKRILSIVSSLPAKKFTACFGALRRVGDISFGL
jgi:hypothetical protein